MTFSFVGAEITLVPLRVMQNIQIARAQGWIATLAVPDVLVAVATVFSRRQVIIAVGKQFGLGPRQSDSK